MKYCIVAWSFCIVTFLQNIPSNCCLMQLWSFILYFIGSVGCPICKHGGWFLSHSSYARHLRSFHGPMVFPYTCGLCFNGRTPDAPCFRNLKWFVKHWNDCHPEYEFARDVVHPDYGNHHLTLPFERLSDFLK